MTNTDTAARIRAALKSAGYTARQVTVRDDSSALDERVDVTIRDTAVRLADVEAIARPFARVARCATTGDILHGGNTYVHVAYDMKSLQFRALVCAVEVVLDRAEASPGEVVEVAGQRVFFDAAPGWFRSLDNLTRGTQLAACGTLHAARQLVADALSRGIAL